MFWQPIDIVYRIQGSSISESLNPGMTYRYVVINLADLPRCHMLRVSWKREMAANWPLSKYSEIGP
jgi:hypothetical protein